MSSLDSTPFLSPSPDLPTTLRAQGLRHAARMIRRASGTGGGGRRPITGPSMTVRETAAQEIEERQVDWFYSSPVVALDAAWNSVFVVAASTALFLTWSDSLLLPLRVWVVGYALQCFLHIVRLCVEFRRRRRRRVTLLDGHEDYFDDSRLCIAFLVLDLFFVIFCVALASVVAVAVCCCLPCIIAILYVLADRGGASKEDIDLLRKYTFFTNDSDEKIDEEIEGPCGGVIKECGTDSPAERPLAAEDAECCICLSAYENGTELKELPCGHHFHCSCVDKWLYINSTCPLCKYDISKSCSHDGEV